MRLWSIHPQYLDTQGLLALWREGLLAQKVLQGRTKGYRHHPQLDRFKTHFSPLKAIGNYLMEVWREADRRGYSFEKKKVKNASSAIEPIPITRGQVDYEWSHLRKKLAERDPVRFKATAQVLRPRLHPLFRSVPGPIAFWEKT